MTTHGWIASATVLAVLAGLAGSRLRPYLVLLAGLLVLLVLGVVDVPAALSGFSNPGLVTVGILFVVAAGVRQTGTLEFFLRRALGRPKTAVSAQTRLVGPVLVGSAFLNNTPLVAMLLPVVQGWCRLARIPSSKLLLPLSYLAILGGLTTLVGTSTNLVVDGLLVERGHPSLGMFGITGVGLPCALVGVLYLRLTTGRLLPDRGEVADSEDSLRRYTVELLVSPAGPLVNRSIDAAGLADSPVLTLTEIQRDGVSLEQPAASEVLRAGDCLVFAGMLDAVVELFRMPGFSPATGLLERLGGHPADRCFAEAVVSRTSPLVGRTIREVGFLERYDAVVLGVARNGQRLSTPLVDVDFRPGDALFVEAERAFVSSHKDSSDFSLISRLEGASPATAGQARTAALILLVMVVAVAFGLLSMLEAAALAAGAMLVTRCVSEEVALASVNWPLLLAIGGAFGLGRALDQTGVAAALADVLLGLFRHDPWASLAVVYLTTAVLTEFVTNNAAAVIVFPIALSAAQQLGVNHVPFVVAVMIGASASFVTPVGYQTNLMVYLAGGYRFVDFIRIGLPLAVLLWIVTTLLAPLVYGF